MSWPSTLLLKVSQGPAKPAARMLVHLRVLDGSKNPYFVGPYLTDDRGEVLIARDSVESEIRRTQELFPMDYGPIDLGQSRDYRVEIEVKSKDALEADLRRSRTFFPDEAQRLGDLVRRSKNDGRRFGKGLFDVGDGMNAIHLQLRGTGD